MNTLRILHTADLHIGAECSYLGARSNERKFEILLTFEKITDLCEERVVDLLLIAGDLFDSNHIDPSLISGVFNALNRLSHTRAVIALGNHDPLTADSPFVLNPLPQNVYLLDKEDSVITFDDLSCRVYGASFDGVYNEGKAHFDLTPPADDYLNLCLLHGETRSDLAGNYRPITPEFVKKSGMDYIALGHIHTRSQVQYVGTTAIAYCGCPEGQGFDESGEKGVYMGEISKGNINLEFVPTAKRQHYRIEVDVTDVTDIAEKIKNAITETGTNYGAHYYRITLTGKRRNERIIEKEELLARLSPLVAFIKIKDKTKAGIDPYALAREKSLKGYFAALMLEKIEKAEKEDEKEKYINALEIGLHAFSEEVGYSED